MITATVAQNSHADDHGNAPNYLLISSPTAMQCDAKFQSSCEYNHGDNDQYDWNKLMGFFDTPGYEARSVRWGWRWSLEHECIEIAPYLHHAGSIVLPPSNQWIQVPLNTWINVKIRLERSNNQYRFTYTDGNNNVTEFTVGVSSLSGTYSGTCRWDLFWFGGTKSAPHEMKIDYDNILFTTCQLLTGATQTWSVDYIGHDGNYNNADGSPSDSYTINARQGSVIVTLGDVQVGTGGTCY